MVDLWKELREFFEGAWKWIQAVWDKHDEALAEMVAAIIPMVIDVAFRTDLTGDEKRKAIVKAIVDNAEETADEISTSMLNEAIEVAANRYNIQIGKVTAESMDAARNAALKASRDFADRKLKIAAEVDARVETEDTVVPDSDSVE